MTRLCCRTAVLGTANMFSGRLRCEGPFAVVWCLCCVSALVWCWGGAPGGVRGLDLYDGEAYECYLLMLPTEMLRCHDSC